MTRTLRTLAAKLFVGVAFLAPLAAVAQDRVPQKAVPEAKKLTAKEQHAKLLKASGWIRYAVPGGTSHGTGGVIDLKRRLMVTNDHVVTGQDTVWVIFPEYKDGTLIREETHYADQKGVKATVIDRDPVRDLAVIQLESLPADAEQFVLAAQEPEEGDTVRTIGGFTNGGDGLVWGGVRGDVRTVGPQENLGKKVRMVLSDASTNGGNSGAPVISEAGELVAVHSAHKVKAINVAVHISVTELKAYLAEVEPLVEPKGAAEFFNRAERKRTAGRADAALLDLRECLKADPKHVPGLLLRARVLCDKKDYRTALVDANKALEVNPEDYRALLYRGRIHRGLKKYEAAIDDLSKAVGVDPAKSLAYNDRGLALEYAGQFAEADADFTRAIEKDGKDAVLYANRGDNRRENLKKPEDAAKDFARSLELNPASADVANKLGLCLLDLKQSEGAVKVFVQACQMDKTNITYRYNLATALERDGQYKDAIEVATAVIKQAADEKDAEKMSDGFFIRSMACRGLKKYDQAVSDATNYLKYCQTDGDRVRALRCRARTYELAGDVEKAGADYDQATKLELKK